MFLAYSYLGNYENALEYLNQSLSLLEKNHDGGHPNAAKVLAAIGKVYYNQGDYATALEYYRNALEIRKNKLGDEHPDTIKNQERITEIENKLEEKGDE